MEWGREEGTSKEGSMAATDGTGREDTDGVVLSDAVLQYLQIGMYHLIQCSQIGMSHFGEGRRQNYITLQVA